MAEKTIKTRLLMRIRTEAEWKALDEVLKKGEIGVSSDKNGMFKVGDGTTAWLNLQYNRALTADRLTSAVSFKIGNTSKSFNGSGGLTWTLSEIGAAASGHTHTKSQITDFPTTLKNPTSIAIKLNGGSTEGTNLFTYDGSAAKTINITPGSIGAAAASHGTHVSYSTANPAAAGAASPGSAATVSRSDHVHPAQTTVSGNAGSATKLQTARNINGVAFNGTSNITITANPTTTILSNQDLNNIKTPGFYSAGGGNTCTNKPSGIDAFGMLVYKTAGGYITQEVTEGNINPGKKYIRQFNSTEWSDYSFFYTSVYKPPTASSADSANKLTTGRNIIIGNASKLFDGSANISYTLDEIGAAPKSHGTHVSFSTTVPKAAGTAAVGTATTVSRSDHVHPAQTSVSGNAGSATKLATARALKIGNTSKNFDGTTALTWTLSEIGAAPAGGSTSITKLASSITLGDGNGATIVQGDGTYRQKIEILDDSTVGNAVFKFSQSEDTGKNYKQLMSINDDGNIVATKFTGALAGNANTASALTSSAGSATQPVYFSGGKPVATTYTLGKSVPSNAVFTDTWRALKGSTASAAGTAGYAPAPAAGAANRYLRCDGTWVVPPDTNTTYTLSSFGITATATELNYMDGVTSNVQTQLNGKAAASHGTHVSFSTAAPKAPGTAAVGTATTVARSDHVHPAQTSVSGNAGSATKLATARTLTIGSIGKAFDGTANVTWTLAEIGAAAASHGTHVSFTTTVPKAPGTASAGTATTVSRSDHIHPAQTSVSGNAGSATKLATARTITVGATGKSFNGTANISFSQAEIGFVGVAGLGKTVDDSKIPKK